MYRILVCDDEKDIVSALKIYLMADGYQVFEAYNGREALEILKKEDIHLVLMDIMMPVELQARVKSQLRRYMKLGGGTVRPDTIVIGGIELNDVTKEVTLDGDKVQLTRTEYDILKLLMQHPGQVFSPNEIYEKVWNDNPFRNENTVAVHIRHLREKVEYNPAEPRHLKVVWGRGYKMEV